MQYTLVVCRKSSVDITYGEHWVMKERYLSVENEIDIGHRDGNRIVAVFLYGKDGDLVDCYSTKGSL